MSPSRRSVSRRPAPSPGSADASGEGGDWRDTTLAELRRIILESDPEIIEEVKWRKPSNPDGVPVWSRNGIVCVGNVLKNAVRLTFPYGPDLADPKKLFNTRLDSRAVRAIDVGPGQAVDAAGLRALVRRAVAANARRARARSA